MDDEESPPDEIKGKPSQVPSWVSLGFALGALFVMALPKGQPPEPVERPPIETPTLRAVTPSRISTIEAVFADWGKYAQWSGAVTQVGLWNPETKSYSDFFEVLRMGDVLFFRSIPALTSPVVSHDIPAECPLEFAQGGSNQLLQEQERADMHEISKSIRETFGPAELPKAPSPK
jgi:hypothetical protein